MKLVMDGSSLGLQNAAKYNDAMDTHRHKQKRLED